LNVIKILIKCSFGVSSSMKTKIDRNIRNIVIALSITFLFFIIELVGGLVTNSLALTTDAWHMLNDSISLLLTLLTSWIALHPVSQERTYGYRRAEVIGAFLNTVILWVMVILIFRESFQRFFNPEPVDSLIVLLISVLGLAANGFSAFILSRSHHEHIGVQGAMLHLFADSLGSIGAILSGAIIYFTEWYLFDPIVSVLIGCLILISSSGLLWRSLNVLLEGVPSHIDLEEVKAKILGQEGIKSIHDLHIWGITPDLSILSSHVIIKEDADERIIVENLIEMLKEEFSIDHTTIQTEKGEYIKAKEEH
jgi:cobalt-zinc-cadmium efflux system protein